MEDKEIIIDGVDVAGCVRLQDDKISCDLGGECKGWESCYYKQLKRLEKQNAKQKDMIDRQWKLLEQCGVHAGGELKRVSYLLEKLREANKELTEDNLNLSKENDRLKEKIESCVCSQDCYAYKKANKYRTTLQEIKAIAEPFAKCYTHTCRNCEKYDSAHACCLKDIHCSKYNDGSKSSCKDFVLPTKQFYQQILANVITKITKAEEE